MTIINLKIVHVGEREREDIGLYLKSPSTFSPNSI